MSIAGLPACNACVCVRPPLFASAPSSGFAFCTSPAKTRLHEASLARLNPFDAGVTPPQFEPLAGFATIELNKVSGVWPVLM